ncbi:MAG: hypothetical protein HY363_06160 [Candidatus Aenigmarchaeota archaeon]|nr:hypothetical protein [Candidatus Aenigmarchaeota archaeon]
MLWSEYESEDETIYFCGHSWQQISRLPKDAAFLVRSVGTENVSDLETGISEYEKKTGKKIPYVMVMIRKDDVRFYVQRKYLKDITDFLKPRVGSGRK